MPPEIRSHDISLTQLRQIAENEKTELKVGVDAENKTVLDPKNEGSWWGARLARSIRVFFLPPPKQASEYMSAKLSVLDSLKKIYGNPIGEQVFRANIGSMRDDKHFSSQYHPIKGSHVAKMLNQ